ncbi:MAG: DUF177 domain-containing protein [Bacteroidota bacterium]
MIIQLATLSEGIHEYDFTVNPSEIFRSKKLSPSHFPDEITFERPIQISVSLDKSSRQIRLRATISTERSALCDRCTDEFLFPVRGKYETIYVFDEQHIPSSDDEIEYVFLSEDKLQIDIAEDVRQTLLLSIPMKLLCKEDCLGVCLHCGKNLNHGSCSCDTQIKDERWSKLQSLKSILSE